MLLGYFSSAIKTRTYKHPALVLGLVLMLSFGRNPRSVMLNFGMRMVLELYVLVYHDRCQVSIKKFPICLPSNDTKVPQHIFSDIGTPPIGTIFHLDF